MTILEQKVIEKFEPFNDIYLNCFENAKLSIMNCFTGTIIPYVFNDVFFYNYTEEDNLPLISLEPKSIFTIEKIMNDLGIARVDKQSNDVVIDLIDSLNKGHSIILFIDCFYESLRIDTFQKNHIGHFITVYGYQLQKQYFNIIEHNYFDSLVYEKKHISFSEIEECYKGGLKFNNTELKTYQEFQKINENKIKDTYYINNYFKNILINKEIKITSFNSIVTFKNKLTKYLLENNYSSVLFDRMIDLLSNIIKIKKFEKYRLVKYVKKNENTISIIESIIRKWSTIRGIIAKYRFSKIILEKSIEVLANRLIEIKQLEFEYLNETLNIQGMVINDE